MAYSKLQADAASYQNWAAGNNTNRAERERMKIFIQKAMSECLTDRQLLCVQLVLLDGNKQKDVAELLGLSRSTVCRHIKAALKKLQKVSKLYVSEKQLLEKRLSEI